MAVGEKKEKKIGERKRKRKCLETENEERN